MTSLDDKLRAPTENSYTQYVVPKATDMLNLGVGQPSGEFLSEPHRLMKRSGTTLSDDHDILQYGSCEGCYYFRDAVASMLQTYTLCKIDPANIYMTNGISQAVLLLSSIYKSKATYAFVETPTYFLMLRTLEDAAYKLKTVDLNNLKDFDDQLKIIFEKEAEQYVLAYIIPFHQNPTGSSFEDINDLVDICDKYPNLIVLSDETYQMLSFFGRAAASLSLFHKNIISMGTMSKILAPGFRVGWIHSTNKAILDKISASGFMRSGGCVNPVAAEMVTSIISTGDFQYHLENVRALLYRKCKILRTAILKYPDFFEVSDPSGGYFLWVKSKKINAEKLLEISKKNKVSFHVGNVFSHEPKFDDFFRLSFSYYSEEDLKVFESRLDKIVEQIREDSFSDLVVHVLGGNGRLGKLIVDECTKNNIKTQVLERGFDIWKDATKSHIYVDVSSPQGTRELLEKLLQENHAMPHVIIGTTGDLPEDLIKKYPESMIKVVSNFSEGIQTINALLKQSAQLLKGFTCKITDIHHTKKKDKPSGTAKTFKSIMIDNKYADPDIISVREGDVVGQHCISFDNEYESLEIIHIAKDRKLFAVGCVNMIKSIYLKDRENCIV